MIKLAILFSILLIYPITVSGALWPRQTPPGVAPGVVCLKSGCNMTGDIYMNNNVIHDATFENVTVVGGIINATDIIDPPWVNKTGDTMTGDLNMSGNNIVDFGTIFTSGNGNITIIGSVIKFVADLFTGKFMDLDFTGTTGFDDWYDNDTQDISKINFDVQISASDIEDNWVNETGDIMTGDLNMTNNSIWNVDTLQVHNITGGSPIYISTDIIVAGFNITGVVYYHGSGLYLTDINVSGYAFYANSSLFSDNATYASFAGYSFDTFDKWVNDTGDTMTGDLNMAGSNITNASNLCYSDGTGCLENFSKHSKGVSPGLYNVETSNGTNIYINDSYLYTVIDNRTGIFEINITVIVATGSGSGTSIFDFPQFSEILSVYSFPTTVTNTYRLSANGTLTGQEVEVDRILHTGIWKIAHRGSTIQGETISAHISDATVDENFTVSIRYRQ